jgi:cellulose synthase/poly-beta-1,6-N-acetylglucosamine synthase-like glycosyltransferase
MRVDHIQLSIIAITKNQAWNIARLLDSVMAELPGLPTSEVIVVDSASTDNTAAIAGSYSGVRVLRISGRQRLTAAAGRYAGFSYSRGEWIVHLDGDTELVPGWISSAIETLERDKTLAGVEGKLCYICEGEAANISTSSSQGGLQECEYLRGPAAIYRRSALEEVGSFDPWIHSEEEAELAIRLRNAGYRLAKMDMFAAVHRDLVSPLTFAGAWARYQRGLLLGPGQVLRKHFGTRLFLLFLRERGMNLVPPLITDAACVLSVTISIVTGAWIWFEGYLAAFLIGLLLLAFRKRSFRLAGRSVVAFELLLCGTIQGMILGVLPASEYAIGGIESTSPTDMSPSIHSVGGSGIREQ